MPNNRPDEEMTRDRDFEQEDVARMPGDELEEGDIQGRHEVRREEEEDDFEKQRSEDREEVI